MNAYVILAIKCLVYFTLCLFIALVTGYAFHEVAAVVALFNTLMLDLNIMIVKAIASARLVSIIEKEEK